AAARRRRAARLPAAGTRIRRDRRSAAGGAAARRARPGARTAATVVGGQRFRLRLGAGGGPRDAAADQYRRPAPPCRAGRAGSPGGRGRVGTVRDGSADVRGPAMNTVLWMTVPYVAFTSFVVGHVWRYRTDQFGWTTRSSQSYESRLLRMGSPLFHFGLLGVFGGHVVGLLIPES